MALKKKTPHKLETFFNKLYTDTLGLEREREREKEKDFFNYVWILSCDILIKT